MSQLVARWLTSTAVSLMLAAACLAQSTRAFLPTRAFCLNEVLAMHERGIYTEQNKKNVGLAENERIAALSAKWSRSERSALKELHRRASKYFHIRAVHELKPGEEQSLTNDYAEALERFANGRLPVADLDDYSRADSDLSVAYELAILRPLMSEVVMAGNVTRQGIYLTERAWLEYCDAWVIFAAVKWPKVSEESWRTWLTRERTRQLLDLSNAP